MVAADRSRLLTVDYKLLLTGTETEDKNRQAEKSLKQEFLISEVIVFQ